MTALLTLFIASLLGIALMIGRKLALVKNGAAAAPRPALPEIPDFQEMKFIIAKRARTWSFVLLVVTIRLYVRSAKFLRRESDNIAGKIRSKFRKSAVTAEAEETQEVSKFLKMISDYKQRVKRIKKRIKDEESDE